MAEGDGTPPGPFDVPRLELDQLLSQLVDRAEDVLRVQGRLRGLIAANQSIIGDLELPVVLKRIVEAACRLVDARYGALGVIAPGGGGLDEFIHVGLDDDTVSAIGHLPQGKGLLGALIEDPRPIRLHDIADDHRSAGFPENHPPMHGFLGVPIEVRGAVFGNLYLSEPASGDFTDEDVALVSSLAATAGAAVENARLFAEAQRRQEWLNASTEVTRELLAGEVTDSLRLVAERLHALAEADLVTVVVPVGDRLEVTLGVGELAQDLTTTTYAAEGSLAEHVLSTGRPLRASSLAEGRALIGVRDTNQLTPLRYVDDLGPVLLVPLVDATRARGVITLGRRRGRSPFSDVLLEMTTTFANHASLALELAEARRDQQRVVLLEDRARIARDLHDHVIQQLFAAGMTVQGVTPGLDDRGAADTLERVVDHIDEAIKQIRTSIFQLRPTALTGASSLRAAVLEVVSEVTPALGLDPKVHFAGPVDAVSDDELVHDVSAVVRELLTNAAKYAGAASVELDVHTTRSALVVSVRDDGVGIGDTSRRSGLDNLRLRAERRSGSFEVSSGQRGGGGGGTHVRWTAPLA